VGAKNRPRPEVAVGGAERGVGVRLTRVRAAAEGLGEGRGGENGAAGDDAGEMTGGEDDAAGKRSTGPQGVSPASGAHFRGSTTTRSLRPPSAEWAR
jgi:hypothetical protein